jgi:hypothetical protein
VTFEASRKQKQKYNVVLPMATTHSVTMGCAPAPPHTSAQLNLSRTHRSAEKGEDHEQETEIRTAPTHARLKIFEGGRQQRRHERR